MLPLTEGLGACFTALLTRIQAVEGDFPLAVRVSRFPQLPHASVCIRRPGNPVHCDGLVGSGGLAFQDHASVAQAPLEKEQGAGSIDPSLVPDFSTGVV